MKTFQRGTYQCGTYQSGTYSCKTKKCIKSKSFCNQTQSCKPMPDYPALVYHFATRFATEEYFNTNGRKILGNNETVQVTVFIDKQEFIATIIADGIFIVTQYSSAL